MTTILHSARARADLDAFIARFTPAIAALIRSCLARMRARLPGATEFVYDNHYALVVGYGPTDRPSDALFSIAAYPDHVSVCFLQGAKLARAGGDPDGLLQGHGNQVRHIRLAGAAALGTRGVRALIARSIARSPAPFDRSRPLLTIVKAVSAHPRPRRPRPGATSRSAPPTRPRRTRG